MRRVILSSDPTGSVLARQILRPRAAYPVNIEAKALWDDPDRLETPTRTRDEPRFQVIARIGDKLWSAFATYRYEVVRIISVRRARAEEKRRYEAQGSD